MPRLKANIETSMPDTHRITRKSDCTTLLENVSASVDEQTLTVVCLAAGTTTNYPPLYLQIKIIAFVLRVDWRPDPVPVKSNCVIKQAVMMISRDAIASPATQD